MGRNMCPFFKFGRFHEFFIYIILYYDLIYLISDWVGQHRDVVYTEEVWQILKVDPWYAGDGGEMRGREEEER